MRALGALTDLLICVLLAVSIHDSAGPDARRRSV